MREQGCDALFYLGNEEHVVASFAERRDRLSDPTLGGELWHRTLAAVDAKADDVARLVEELRAHEAWTQVVFLGNAPARRLTTPSGLDWVLCYDRSQLSEYDGSRATLVAYGNAERCFADRVDGQIVVTPGRWDRAGIAIVDDTTRLVVTAYDQNHQPVFERHLESLPVVAQAPA